MSCCFGARPTKSRLSSKKQERSSIPKGKKESNSDGQNQKSKPKQGNSKETSKLNESLDRRRESSKQLGSLKQSKQIEGIDEEQLALVMNFNFDLDTLDGISAPIRINQFRYQSILNHLPPNQMGSLSQPPKLQPQ